MKENAMKPNSWISYIQEKSRHPWVVGLVLAVCFVAWFSTRIVFLYAHQVPPNQTIHPNYFTFHEMSQSWNEGKKLGTIDMNRMLINGNHPITSDYIQYQDSKDEYCTYMSLDPGLAIIISAARNIMSFLPDSYLRLVSLQMILDGIMMFVIFFTFLRMGIVPAAVTTLVYGAHSVFAYQAIFPFQYFWEGWLFSVGVIAMIWARRASLEKRQILAIVLIALVGLTAGFALWVRSTAVIAAIMFMGVFLTVPNLRRYSSVFFIVFALTIVPQVMRASSATGHFAISTRMSWHTAYQALGQFPNKYGLEDDDLYVFTKSQNDYGTKYNYCNYAAHDKAIQKAYINLWQKDPAFVTRAIISRVVNNIIFNFDLDAPGYLGLTFTLLGLLSLLYASLRRGEDGFTVISMAMVYLGYCTAVGLVYYMGPPYANVTQLAILFTLPFIVKGAVSFVHDDILGEFSITAVMQWVREQHAPIAKALFTVVLVSAAAGAMALALPPVRAYVFQKGAYQSTWASFQQPNREDNQKIAKGYDKLSPADQKRFMALVHKTQRPTGDIRRDITFYIRDNYYTLVYLDHVDNTQKAIFTFGPQKVDSQAAMQAVTQSILGWKMNDVYGLNIADPQTWDGRTIHIKLDPTPEREGVDYQRLANEKFKRYNFDVTWLGPNELVAHHNGRGCDAMRAVMSMYYHGYCPYDAATGDSPLLYKDKENPAAKSLTSGGKTAE